VKRILIGVTIDDSLQFHTGLPELLVANGWDVHIVTGPGRRIEALRSTFGITVHVIPMAREPKLFQDIVSLMRWVWVILLVRPDTTIIGTPKAALLGNFASRLMRVRRRIYVLHGLRLETAVGLQRHLLLFIERVTAQNVHEILAVSESLKELAIDLATVPKDKIVVLGRGSCNGIDVEKYRSATLSETQKRILAEEIGLDQGIPTVGFVGRITRDKGLPELADALRILYSRGVPLQLLLVGSVDGDSGKEALDELMATKQAVVAAGYRSDPTPFYQLMDVFCLPSLREGLPGVILEAMASRTAVVGTDATGIVDVLNDGVTGRIVAKRSAPELALALHEMISNRSQRLIVVENAYNLVATEFDTKQVQGELMRFLGAGYDAK
jgi:glycosyltransferase involved in cell wall biosynthesis